MTKPLPIVHFLYEPGDGGLDRVAIYLANGMAERGIKTELWLTKPDGPLAKLISPEVTVRLVPTPRIGGRGVQLLLQIPALAKMIREYQPRAIFSAGNQSNLSIAIAQKLGRQVPTKIIQKITNPIKRPNMSRWAVKLRRIRFGRTIAMGDYCLALSSPDTESYRKMFPISAGKIDVVANAYVTPEMLAIGAKRPDNSYRHIPNLLAVGRVSFQKDYHNLLEALAKNKNLDWHLTILGDGPLMEEIRSLAAKLDIADRILFEGFVTNAAPYYEKADILLLSSRWEGFAAVPLEAMAAGCDIVATDSSAGLTYLLAQKDITTQPVEDPEALAEAIKATLIRKKRRDLRPLADQYSLANSVDDHLRVLEKCESIQPE